MRSEPTRILLVVVKSEVFVLSDMSLYAFPAYVEVGRDKT